MWGSLRLAPIKQQASSLRDLTVNPSVISELISEVITSSVDEGPQNDISQNEAISRANIARMKLVIQDMWQLLALLRIRQP